MMDYKVSHPTSSTISQYNQPNYFIKNSTYSTTQFARYKVNLFTQSSWQLQFNKYNRHLSHYNNNGARSLSSEPSTLTLSQTIIKSVIGVWLPCRIKALNLFNKDDSLIMLKPLGPDRVYCKYVRQSERESADYINSI